MGTSKRERQKQNRTAARAAQARAARRNKVKGRTAKWGGLVAVLVVALFAVSQFDNGKSSTSTSDSTADSAATGDSTPTLSTLPGRQITGKTPCPKTDGTEERATKFENAPSMCIDPQKTYTATFDTSEGKIVVDLDTKNTPNTVNNFVTLSRYKYYDTSYVFRTDPSIDIIQGGGATNTDDPGYSIKDEGNGFKYKEGDLVMARTSAPDSAGGQWFFVTGSKASLLDSQGTYVTFGHVSTGLDVVKSILALNSGAGDLGGAPSTPVQIKTVTISEK